MMDVPDYLGIDSTDEERAEQLASLWRFVAPFAPLEVLHAAAAISPDDLTVHEESRGSLKFWTSSRSVFVLDRAKGRMFWSVWTGDVEPGGGGERTDGFVELSRIVEDAPCWPDAPG